MQTIEWLTYAQVADLLGVTVYALSDMVRRGDAPPSVRGRFRIRDFETWLDDRAVRP